MILKTFLTYKPPVAFSTLHWPIFKTGWFRRSNGTIFVTLVCFIIYVKRFTFVLLGHNSFEFRNGIEVFAIVWKLQFLF